MLLWYFQNIPTYYYDTCSYSLLSTDVFFFLKVIFYCLMVNLLYCLLNKGMRVAVLSINLFVFRLPFPYNKDGIGTYIFQGV